MSTTLSRSTGSSGTYTHVELANILVGLEAANNTHQVASGVAFIRIGALQLLLLDVDALHNRKLLETYANHYRTRFTSNSRPRTSISIWTTPWPRWATVA